MSVSKEAADALGVSVEFLEYTKKAYENDTDGSFTRFIEMPIRRSCLLLACAAVRRIRDMLSAGFGSTALAIRYEGDEFVYQSLYRPILGNLSLEADYADALGIAKRVLPTSLDELAKEAGPNLWEDRLQPGLSELDAELSRLCVRERVNPYDPGPDALLKGQDEYIATLTERSAQLVEETANKSGQTMARRGPLTPGAWQAFVGGELEGAIAALKRIRSYWRAVTVSPWFVVVPDDDNDLYDTLYHDLFFMLAQRHRFDSIAEELRQLVPETPPDHDLALILDEEVKGDIFGNLTRARRMLNKVMIADGKTLEESSVEHLFSVFDPAIESLAKHASDAAEAEAKRLGLLKDDIPEDAPAPQRSKPRAGRKPITLDYESAQQAYWDVFDALEVSRETRRPSHKDVCDRLAKSGTSIGVTTFGKRVNEWRTEGRDWPPPRQ